MESGRHAERERELNLLVEDDSDIEEIEVKNEGRDEDYEVDMEIEMDRRNDPIYADAESEYSESLVTKEVFLQCRLQESQCLICFRNDPDPRPLKGLLPNGIMGLRSPEQVQDDMRTIHVLKILFKWNSAELTNLMKLSNGECPSQWIHICEQCLPLVFQIQTLEDQIVKCRAKIRERILESDSTGKPRRMPLETMTGRIRSLVTQQVKSSVSAKAALTNGDLEAERLVNLRMQRRKEPEPPHFQEDYSLDSDGFGFENEDMFLVQSSHDEYESETRKDVRRRRSSKRVRKRKTKPRPPPQFPPPPAPSLPPVVMEECFTCPYCCSSPAKKMNMVEFFYHLIYHNDYPMRCQECKVFLPRDSAELDAHWQQYHSIVKATTPELRFLDLLATDVQTDDGSFSPKKQQHFIKCGNCLKEKDLEIEFESIGKFKIHQALKHPEVARESCPFCTDNIAEGKLKTKIAIERHIRSAHGICLKRFLLSHVCKFCGERHLDINAPQWTSKESRWKLEKMHMMSSHSHLINTSYTCIQCSQEFSHLKDFVEHAKSTKTNDHPEINWNTSAVNLYSISRDSINCELCHLGRSDSEEESRIFLSVKTFLCHLTLSHSLYLKWENDPLKPNVRDDVEWKSIEEHVKQMKLRRRFMEIKPKKTITPKSSHSKGKARYEASRPRKYSCHACPQLKEMNVDYFIVHLLYHWRHPNKCTSCKVLLPFAAEAIEDHWKQYHSDSDSSNLPKSEPAHFTPGNLFGCQKCPRTFLSSRDRNEHELSHGSVKSKSKSCNVCGECFINSEEVRLHKALDHPEVASISCFYCEDLFAVDSVEGGQYLDSETVQQHIVEKEDHPKDDTAMACHLYACELCGEVIADNFKNGKRVRTHVSKAHGKECRRTSFMCFICSKALFTSPWSHLSSVHAKNSICETCGEEMRPYALPDHCLVTHNILMKGFQELRCEQEGCHYKTVRSSSFNWHVSANHNSQRQKEHKCSLCEKAFFSSRDKKEHEERHRNKETKPYQCEICGSSFAVRNYLYIHKRLSHLNQKFPSTNRKRSKKETPAETSTT